MLERGIAVRQGIGFLRTELPTILATRTDALSPRMLRVIEELAGDWRRLDQRIEGLSSEIEALARQDQACSRLMTVPGIGPIISSAMVAAIGNGEVFSKGRDFGAWLGLVPKQISTGDRTILGKISKHGNRYLRVLFVQAAWVVLVNHDLGAPRAQVLDRSRQEAAAPQRAGNRARQQACSHRLGGSQKERTSNAPGPMGWRPDLLERGTVLGCRGGSASQRRASATAALDGPCARRRM